MAGPEADEQDESGHAELPEKHQLQCTWCVWVLLHNSSVKENWQHSQMNVHSFSTVEDFWRLFNNIKAPSKLGSADFSIFKKDVAPAWEDEVCRQGGRWLAKVDKMKSQDMDQLWLNVVLRILGEGFGEEGSCICGAVVSPRAKNSKVALWISDREEAKVMAIGRAYLQVLQESGFTGDLAFEDFQSQEKGAFLLQGTKSLGAKLPATA